VRLDQAWTVARHDLVLVRRRRAILAALVAAPLGVSIGFPLLVHLILSAGAAIPGGVLVGLLDAFSFFYVIVGTILPVNIASYSIVGEKTEKSLEPLLATPTTDGEILLGKTLAALVPTMIAIWSTSILFMGLTDAVTRSTLGYLLYPDAQIVVLLVVLAPLASLFAIEISVVISAKATDVRSAQQLSGVLFFPFILLYLLAEIGVLVLDAPHLVLVAAVIGLVDLALFSIARRTFHRDEILTRWK
jgi:ABC-2 type transport system permease protein